MDYSTTISESLQLLGPAVLANLLPWIQGMLTAQTWDAYNFQKGLATIIEVVVSTLVIYFGLNVGFGIDVSTFSVAVGTACAHYLYYIGVKLWNKFHKVTPVAPAA